MAHRGFSRDGMENSMAAFRAAVELGCRYVETDVHTTSDGVLLLFHDAVAGPAYGRLRADLRPDRGRGFTGADPAGGAGADLR